VEGLGAEFDDRGDEQDDEQTGAKFNGAPLERDVPGIVFMPGSAYLGAR